MTPVAYQILINTIEVFLIEWVYLLVILWVIKWTFAIAYSIISSLILKYKN